MNKPLGASLLFAMGMYVIVSVAIAPQMQANAQSRGPFSPGDETPQRMCVGMVRDGALIGFERIRQIRECDRQEYNALTWYRGDLTRGSIVLSEIQTNTLEGQTATILRRWYWEHERLWLGFEALYGAVGPYASALWRTSPRIKIDTDSTDREEPQDRELHSVQKAKTLLERCKPRTESFGIDEFVENVSLLDPLTFRAGGVHPIDVDCLERDGEGGSFYHGNDGFDFIPHTLNHWTLFMTVGHTMRIWDGRSGRVATAKDEEIRNTWTLVSELWVPWKGAFFVFERFPLYEYVLVRDCGEVHLLRLDRGARPNEAKTDQRKIWRGWQLLDPVDYLIALLYIEPENTVYGFGPNFYVRLATSERPWPPEALPSSHTKKPCRDVTKGKAIWTDEDGESHELGEPFRTIWQCANVLKEEGVLD